MRRGRRPWRAGSRGCADTTPRRGRARARFGSSRCPRGRAPRVWAPAPGGPRRATRAVEFRIVRLPAGLDPADVVQRSGGDELRALLDSAVEIERFEVERALAQAGATKDAMLADAVRAIAPLPPSVLRDDLVRVVSNRLALHQELVNEALRAPAGAGPPPPAVEGRRWVPEGQW